MLQRLGAKGRVWLLIIPLVGVAVAADIPIAPNAAQASSGPIALVSSICEEATPGGRAQLTESLVLSGGDMELTMPCHLVLEDGVSLALHDTVLRTRNLIISDSPGPIGSELRLTNASLLSEEDSGLLIDFANPSSEVSLQVASVRYPLSIWIRTVGQQDGDTSGGLIDVSQSELISTGRQSDGIMLLASENGGKVRITDSEVHTSAGLQLAFAGVCSASNTPGLPEKCGSAAVLSSEASP